MQLVHHGITASKKGPRLSKAIQLKSTMHMYTFCIVSKCSHSMDTIHLPIRNCSIVSVPSSCFFQSSRNPTIDSSITVRTVCSWNKYIFVMLYTSKPNNHCKLTSGTFIILTNWSRYSWAFKAVFLDLLASALLFFLSVGFAFCCATSLVWVSVPIIRNTQ